MSHNSDIGNSFCFIVWRRWKFVNKNTKKYKTLLVFFVIKLKLKAILHYALGLRFGNVRDQNATKTRPKRN